MDLVRNMDLVIVNVLQVLSGEQKLSDLAEASGFSLEDSRPSWGLIWSKMQSNVSYVSIFPPFPEAQLTESVL